MNELTLWWCQNCQLIFRATTSHCPRCDMKGAKKVSKGRHTVAPLTHLDLDKAWICIRKMRRI